MTMLGLALAIAIAPAQPPAAAPPDLPPDVAASVGPRGTSGEAREDVVGYAGAMPRPPAAPWSAVTVGVAHPDLPPGTLVELTALDTGRTIVAMVVPGVVPGMAAADADGAVVALSPGAARALGVGEHVPVRVRTAVASPQDRAALRAGQAASPRLDAPPALLAALRRRLPVGNARRSAFQSGAGPLPHPASHSGYAVGDRVGERTGSARRGSARLQTDSKAPVEAAVPAPPARPAAARGGAWVVQVAALSSAGRAAALARQLGGRVAPLGKLYRVQLGPFADAAGAQRARDGAARRGYADARILHAD